MVNRRNGLVHFAYPRKKEMAPQRGGGDKNDFFGKYIPALAGQHPPYGGSELVMGTLTWKRPPLHKSLAVYIFHFNPLPLGGDE